MEGRALLSAVSWTGDAGDDNWDTPGNWSTDSVPGASADVTIDTTAAVVHSDDVTDTINSLTTTEPLSITGGTLSIASASTIGGGLSVTGGTLTVTGAITVSGFLTITGGTLSGSGTITANVGMALFPNTTSTVTLDGVTLVNPTNQLSHWNGDGGQVIASHGSVFNNLGFLELQSLGTLDLNPTFLGSGALEDYSGTVVIQGNSPNFSGSAFAGSRLQVDGSLPGTAVSIGEGGTLSGTGSVGAISANGGGETVSPGDGGQPGILTADSNVTLNSAFAFFNVALDGTIAGTGYGQLDAKGSVSLGGSTLTGSLGFCSSRRNTQPG